MKTPVRIGLLVAVCAACFVGGLLWPRDRFTTIQRGSMLLNTATGEVHYMDGSPYAPAVSSEDAREARIRSLMSKAKE